MLKACCEELAEPLSLVLQKSYDKGILPNEWKRANITAVYKKGDLKDTENYWPISLTSVICKLMESFIRDHIIQYMEENNGFYHKSTWIS